MAGIENSIVFGEGFKLQPSSARAISDMQRTSVDISRVNHTGSPEGVVSANPSSFSHDPVSGIIYVKQSGTGNTGWAALSTTTGTVTSVSGTANRITSTGGATPVIDISASYVGQTSITTLGTIATGTWNATNIALNKGGTNAALTASNGGIFYSTATAGAILAGTATAGQMLRSGASAAPIWSTATYPATAGTSGNVLTSDGTNWSSATPIVNVGVTSFTPVLNFGGATTGITYTNQGGKYVRAGSIVYFEVFITLSSKGSATGAATITGLPLSTNASSHRSVQNLIFDFQFNAYPTLTTNVFSYINSSSSTINLAANASAIDAANITDTTFQNGTQFTISGSYMV